MRYGAHLAGDFVDNLGGRAHQIARSFVRLGSTYAAQHHFERGHALHGRLMKVACNAALLGIARVE
jgi:hypothetical protein